MPVEERIVAFVAAHPDIDGLYGDLFKWHNILTGSCEFGRREWCRMHGLKPDDTITIRRFLEETRNEYGGQIIEKLIDTYRRMRLL